MCFPVNFVKFLRATIFIEHFRWLLLNFNHQIQLKKTISQVLFKHSMQEREVAIRRRSFTLNLLKLSLKKLICNEVARCQPASLQKKLFHNLLHEFCHHFLRMLYHSLLLNRGTRSNEK